LLLSDLLTENDKIIGLLKFGKREHIESLQRGNLYLNNYDFFRKLEKESGKKGQGDAHDVSLIINNVEFELQNPETSQVILKGTAQNTILESKEDYERHLHCLTGITSNLLEVIENDGENAKVRLKLPDELREKATEDFGGYVAFINSGPFIDRIKEYCKQHGILFFGNMVRYIDMSINHSNRIKAFNENDVSIYFEKDVFFKFQNEYRLLFPEIISDVPETLQLGSLEGIVNIMSVEAFLNSDLIFNLKLYAIEDEYNKKLEQK
jgi:hypothetical protein